MLDALVIGEGPAGAAFAVAAAAGGMRVGLASHLREKTRGETLEPRVEEALRALGVWEESRCAALPLSGVLSLWDESEPVERPAVLNVRGPHLGVDRARFDAPLKVLARKRASAVFGRVRLLREEGSRWMGHADGGALVGAHLLVIATGRIGCPIGRGARDGRDRLVALMSFALSQAGAPAEFCIEAVPDGWWYASPLPSGRSVVAYMTDADAATGGPRDKVDRLVGRLERGGETAPPEARAPRFAEGGEAAPRQEVGGRAQRSSQSAQPFRRSRD
jgi:hypothetical protein